MSTSAAINEATKIMQNVKRKKNGFVNLTSWSKAFKQIEVDLMNAGVPNHKEVANQIARDPSVVDKR